MFIRQIMGVDLEVYLHFHQWNCLFFSWQFSATALSVARESCGEDPGSNDSLLGGNLVFGLLGYTCWPLFLLDFCPLRILLRKVFVVFLFSVSSFETFVDANLDQNVCSEYVWNLFSAISSKLKSWGKASFTGLPSTIHPSHWAGFDWKYVPMNLTQATTVANIELWHFAGCKTPLPPEVGSKGWSHDPL